MNNMLFSFGVLIVGAGVAAAGASKSPPNVILNVVDDLGWNDVGWRDQFNQILTPRLDK